MNWQGLIPDIGRHAELSANTKKELLHIEHRTDGEAFVKSGTRAGAGNSGTGSALCY